MYCFMVLYGTCLPADWLREEICSVIFLSGDFDLVAFSEAVMPMALCIPFVMPIIGGRRRFNTWTWSGPATLIVLTIQMSRKHNIK